ncbi:MAG: chromosome segregation protein SMC, partial [Clostridia bacterium]|nr:chromosome segregation protein SMC [Clostridia bacterium]
ELLEAESSVKSMRYSMETAKLQLQEAEVELSRLTARRENEDSSLVKLSEEKENIAQGVEYLTQKTAQITENIAKYKAEMAIIEKSSMENAEKLAEVTAEQASNNAFMAELTDKIMSSNERIAALDSEKQGNSDMIRHLESLIAELHSEREGRKSGIDSYKEKIAAFEKERAGLDDKIKAFEQSEKQTQAEIRSKIDEKLELEGKRERIQRDSKNKNETINNLEHESVRLESKKNQDVMQKQQILDKMWESYELTPITAQSVRAEITDVPEANRRLGQLKNEIRSLGNVNLSAVEEYEKLFERYSFLNSQREDLEKAKGDILKIITDLTKNMQETFAKHFEMLNKSFGETFVEIFGGGNAYLQLEDEKDILNCGIDIKVTLPGKTVKTISLLSGGEKAFVAIALYFAILKVRPTPFCILDEIEAALDDVNVDKYISYMRTLCKNTQFIVITHRRGTMEGADILYGVAMQETGVSKLLTINVSEIEEKIRLNV